MTLAVIALAVALCALLVTVFSHGRTVARRTDPVTHPMDRFAVWVWRRRPKRWLP